jgi:thiol-disulfide isomerase/thioredoxin
LTFDLLRSLLISTAAPLLLGGLIVACRTEPSATAPLIPDSTVTEAGKAIEVPETLPPLPDLVLTDIQGDTLALADYRGRVILLNFWATWCAPCLQEMPDLNRLHQDLEDEGVAVIGVSTDEGGPEAVRAAVENLGIAYPVILDDGTLSDHLGGVYALPTTFIVDAQGNVTSRIIGIFPINERREELVALASQSSSGR